MMFMKKIFTLRVLLLLIVLGVGFSQKATSQIVKFDLSTLPGGTNLFGASPLTPTSSNANTTIVGLTRGAGIGTTGTAAAKAWGGTGFTTTNNTQALALAGNQIVTFTITANAGNNVSLTGIPIYNIRRSAAGPSTGIWQYQVGAGAFTDIGTAITWGAVTTSAGNDQAAIDLSVISALQNVPAGTTITLRVILWGSTATSGTWYFNDQTSGTRDLIVNGSTAVAGTPTFSFGGAALTAFSTLVGTPSAQQSYTISGLNLTPNQTNGISVVAPADFEVSLTSNTFTGTNANTVLLSSNGTGNIVGEPKTIYVRYFPAAAGTTSANIAHSGAGVSPAQNQAVSGTSTAYYYSKATGDLTNPATFNTATDGSGSDAANFTGPNQTFEIRNRTTATITSDWTVSGTSSKIVVGNGVTFTIPLTNLVAGKIDVLASGDLVLQNTTLPTLGTLATGSIVEYAQTGAVSILNTTTDLVTYSNLKLSGSGTKSFKNATTTVTGALTYDGNTNGPLTIDAASAATFTTINLGGDLTYLGTVTSPVDANAYTLVTTSTGTQTITGNNNVARFFRITENSAGNNVVLSTVGGTTNALVGNLTSGGITLTNATSTLSLNGNILTFFAGNVTATGAGSITGSATSNIVINKIGAATFGTLNFTSGSRSLNSLTINNTATTPTVTLGTAVDIYGTLTVTAGQIVLGANNLTLKSTATGTARFATTTMAAPISYNSTGKVVVERYISNIGRKWRLLSTRSTVSTQTIFDSWQEGGVLASNLGTWITAPGGANGFDGSSNSSSILKHDQVTPSWVALTATNTGTINDDQGYMLFVRGDRNDQPGNATNSATVLRTTGQLRVGAQAPVTISSTGTGYTLVGNPFASPIDFESIYTTTNLDQQFYVWDATLAGNYGVGGYRLVERNGGAYQQTPVVLGGGATPDANSRYIHSGQAFFLKATGADASVVFDENSKTAQTSVVNPIMNTERTDQQLIVNLMLLNGHDAALADGIRVRFDASYLAATSDDILKIGNFGENISSYRDGKKLIVEKRPLVTTGDIIYLRMSNTVVRDYRLQIGALNFVQPGVTAYLEDTYKGTRTPLSLSGDINNIDFSINADAGSANPDRFKIVFTAAKGAVPVITITHAVQQGNNIAVEWKMSNQLNISKYVVEKSTDAVNFAAVASVATSGTNGSEAIYNWLDINATAGTNYYRISSIGNSGERTYSNVVNVNMGKTNPVVSIYPNPVSNRTIALQFRDMVAGVYRLRLLNNMGQAMMTTEFSHPGGTATKTIELDKDIRAGTYHMEIIKPDNTKTVQKLVITE